MDHPMHLSKYYILDPLVQSPCEWILLYALCILLVENNLTLASHMQAMYRLKKTSHSSSDERKQLLDKVVSKYRV